MVFKRWGKKETWVGKRVGQKVGCKNVGLYGHFQGAWSNQITRKFKCQTTQQRVYRDFFFFIFYALYQHFSLTATPSFTSTFYFKCPRCHRGSIDRSTIWECHKLGHRSLFQIERDVDCYVHRRWWYKRTAPLKAKKNVDITCLQMFNPWYHFNMWG